MFNTGLGPGGGMRASRETYLKAAVAADPKFAVAWAELGSHQVNNRNVIEAKASIDTALKLAPSLPEAIAAHARYYMMIEGD